MFLAATNPEMTLTLAVLLAACGLVAAMAWLERRPRAGLNPRLVPTTPLLFLGMFAAMVAAVHLVNLLGVQTGR